jgi:hypothetical protein
VEVAPLLSKTASGDFPGAVFMPLGTGLGTLDRLITLGHLFSQTPSLPEKEYVGVFGSVSVIVSENVRVGLPFEVCTRSPNAREPMRDRCDSYRASERVRLATTGVTGRRARQFSTS